MGSKDHITSHVIQAAVYTCNLYRTNCILIKSVLLLKVLLSLYILHTDESKFTRDEILSIHINSNFLYQLLFISIIGH